jgi:uncharacterized protein (AIM24 family)
MDDGTREIRPSRALGTAPYEEEFLFHLSRGSEFLVENHVERAKEELERALRYQPHDAKGQDLLASVYFRLGLYPRAIEIWSRLARQHPNDLALRVNLGLVLLKTGQPEEARANFARATEIDPKHARAYRYLGLAEWRCGRLDAARASFLKGGEVTMARRMEEMLGETTEPASPSAGDGTASAERAEVRGAASEALERFATETAPLAVARSAEDAAIGPWRVVEQGVESTPRTTRAERSEAHGEVSSLASRLATWSVAPSEGPALSVAANGFLRIATRDPVVFRRERLVAVRGAASTEVVARRGRKDGESAGTLGGDSPLVRAEAGIVAFVAPSDGHHFTAIALADDALFVVEQHLEAFEGTLSHESARVGSADVVSLRGSGVVVLRLRAQPSALDVAPGDVAHVEPRALVGWTGRLFPAEPDGVTVPGMLAFRGEGTLLVV